MVSIALSGLLSLLMRFSLLSILIILFVLIGCYSKENYFLDPGIPRVETPSEKIASVRTKWYNEKHIETAFLDSSDRVLELFHFGLTSSKTRNQYKGNKTTYYYHSDSAPYGWVTISTTYRKYNSEGRLVSELIAYKSEGKPNESKAKIHYTRRTLGYATNGDTIVRKIERNYEMTDRSNYIDIDRWEQDDKKRVSRHYRLYVMPRPSGSDTTDHYSQRYAYDSSGRLAMRWYDYMYLGQFYRPRGPDTTWYSYDARSRLVQERHVYTTSMSNKSEPDSAGLGASQKESRDWYREKVFCR